MGGKGRGQWIFHGLRPPQKKLSVRQWLHIRLVMYHHTSDSVENALKSITMVFQNFKRTCALVLRG